MFKKKKSIHTIARDLGVSATTISFIINGKAKENRISSELIKKVEDHLGHINYKPDIIAQSLRTGKSNLIGMLMEDISDAFFPPSPEVWKWGWRTAAINCFL